MPSDLASDQHKHELLFCACAFISPDIAVDHCSWLDEDAFVDEALGKYWKALKEHGDSTRAAVDANVLSDLSGEVGNIPSSLYPEEYARAIMKFHYLSQTSREVQKIAKGIYERDENMIRSAIESINENKMVDTSTAPMNPEEINKEFVEVINNISPSIMTGIQVLDDQMGGLYPSELTILAARPGVGKTSLAMAMAQNIVLRDMQSKVLVFSLEMSRIQLWARMACAKAGISWKTIRSGKASAEHIEMASNCSRQLVSEFGDRLLIEDQVWDVPRMCEIATRLKPQLIIVDHLGEIKWHGDDDDEVRWFGKAAKMLRADIARRLNTHVILIHQLSRKVEGQTDKRPILSDLKWSGDLEATADIVIMPYRDDYYANSNTQQTIVPMELWTRKNRQGSMNACAMINFNVETQRFFPYTDDKKIVGNTHHMWYDNN